VDIEDAFRGYLLTRQEKFLQPLLDAEPRVPPTADEIMRLVEGDRELAAALRHAAERLAALADSKHDLIRRLRAGREEEVLAYVRSGQGLALSDAVRQDLRVLEDTLDRRSQGYEGREAALVQRVFWGLLLAVAGSLALGLLYVRLLSRSITGPLADLRRSVEALSASLSPRGGGLAGSGERTDEIGALAGGFQEMAGLIRRHLREIEALAAIGQEINTIRADGLSGVLRRITDRACELLQVDVCMVMLRNERMGCWIVEAASGDWHDRLHKSVMLWEEFPVSVQAFQTGRPAFGENLRADERPEVRRRNLMGQSMLSIPLLSQGAPFGVLVLLQDRPVGREGWNVPLAAGFANEAAVAIANARLYEAVEQKGRGLESRLRQLEHLAETLAHDLKGPGERIGGLAASMLAAYGRQLDDRARRWLKLMDEEGRQLSARIESLLDLARLGGRTDSLEMVDPGLVLSDVLKEWAGELERGKVKVRVAPHFPPVVCHRAYLRQILDNLLSNGIKFTMGQPEPEIRIGVERRANLVCFSVSDNGPGIPERHRERVFEPFVRLNQEGPKGSGLGLAIVKRIVEMYGGTVRIEPGGRPGCTVTFTLPAAVDLAAHPAADPPGGGRRATEERHDQPDI
jgi:signal transduction histidine kinase/CHASE3 domain sensor protein